MPLSRYAALFILFIVAFAAVAQDVVTVGTATANNGTADVPVYIRDTSGTPLGIDRPAGSRIQSYSIKVNYSPASAVSAVAFSRAGITANLTPVSEFSPASSGAISLLDTFQESTNLIPFNSNAGLPGNLVAHLVFTLSGNAQPGTSITLTLDSSLTQLTDEGGTAATKETQSNGQLTLNGGVVNIPAATLSLTPDVRTVTVGSSTSFTATLSANASSDTTVSLVSSAPAIASVPASAVITSGSRSVIVDVNGVSPGSATITATASGTSAQASVFVNASCVTPAAPHVSAPSTAPSGTTYNVTWLAITGATEYLVDESTDAAFMSPSTTTVTTATASFSHATQNVRYYYRVRARAKTSSCDTTSDNSNVVSVLITAGSGVLTVVGSTPGTNNSFFKTAVQMYNPTSTTISGKIVYHPQGVTGSDADPTLAYAIPPHATRSYGDLLPAMGVASGIGSADVVSDGTSPLPSFLVRVFNDAGVLGTSGLTEDLLTSDAALQAGDSGVLFAPADVHAFRLNVGVRTLGSGASMNITVRDKDGVVVKTTSHTYTATFFTQPTSAGILDGYTLTGGETITFDLTSGAAIIYGATTDNTTNDPSVQFAHK
ncbi:MAG TPA: hypothetical protein VF219_10240 [Vicinamibacterales bacterium]